MNKYQVNYTTENYQQYIVGSQPHNNIADSLDDWVYADNADDAVELAMESIKEDIINNRLNAEYIYSGNVIVGVVAYPADRENEDDEPEDNEYYINFEAVLIEENEVNKLARLDNLTINEAKKAVDNGSFVVNEDDWDTYNQENFDGEEPSLEELKAGECTGSIEYKHDGENGYVVVRVL